MRHSRMRATRQAPAASRRWCRSRRSMDPSPRPKRRGKSSNRLAEMNGEYRGEQLRSSGVISTVIATLFTNNPLLFGKWLSKSFRPVDDTCGRGYNSLMHRGRVTRQGPMRTLIAPSRFDGRSAYQLVYRAYHSICGFVHMVDEVRRLDAGKYLGIGTIGFTDAQRRVPLPFLLTGPLEAPTLATSGRKERDSTLPVICQRWHARSLRPSPENSSNLRLVGGDTEIRTLGSVATTGLSRSGGPLGRSRQTPRRQCCPRARYGSSAH
jgi:hypothetical protein